MTTTMQRRPRRLEAVEEMGLMERVAERADRLEARTRARILPAEKEGQPARPQRQRLRRTAARMMYLPQVVPRRVARTKAVRVVSRGRATNCRLREMASAMTDRPLHPLAPVRVAAGTPHPNGEVRMNPCAR